MIAGERTAADRAASPGDEARPRAGRDVVLYFALTFGVAWLLWLVAAAIAPPHRVVPGVRSLLFLPGTFAPAIVALLLTAHHEGSRGVHALLDRLFRWQVRARWYVIAIAFLPAVKLTAAVIHYGLLGAWPPFGATPVYALLGAIALSTPFQAGEELGWRGYALPRMAPRLGVGAASVLLGGIWAAWHLPLFYIAATTTSGQPFPVYLVSVTALSVVMAWLFVRTGGSLLLVMIMHAAVNNTAGIVSGRVIEPVAPLSFAATPMAWITTGVLWAAALVLLARLHARRGAAALQALPSSAARSVER